MSYSKFCLDNDICCCLLFNYIIFALKGDLWTMRQLGIYIHIPFCVKKCNYCDFLSMKIDDGLVESYVAALIKEINSYKDIDGYEVSTVFFGGGTPSVLKEELLIGILSEIKKVFKPLSGAEITVECNPGTLCKEKLKAYNNAGINRLSIGLQSVIESELKTLGRIHDYAMFLENYKNAREAGFDNINIDIMSALPGQTFDSYKKTLEVITDLKPEHISAYSLIIEEETPFYEMFIKSGKKNIDGLLLPSEEEDRRMYEYTKEFLSKKGYYRYEISNYAKKGYESRHNRFYWDRTEYIGLGLNSSSFLMDERYKNTSQIDEYTRLSYDYRNLKRECVKISQKDAMEEFMYLGLRMCEGVSASRFNELFDIGIYDIYGNIIYRMNHLGYLSVDNDIIALTDKGIDISNKILCEFLL